MAAKDTQTSSTINTNPLRSIRECTTSMPLYQVNVLQGLARDGLISTISVITTANGKPD